MNFVDKEAIAIVGIGCRFPGRVHDVESFWSLLMEGKSGIRDVPADRWNVTRFQHPDRSIPGKLVTPRGGYLDRIDQFDASFFGISPREASRMDPQQRWLLEVAWEAFEDAGVAPSALKGSQTGVFVGISAFDYATMQTTNRRGVDVHSASGMALSIASNRLSYWFDLRGPSLSVDTACSSALVALHLACESIRNGESEMALAGGVNALVTPGATIAFSKAGMLSPDGECYAFDSRANGFVRAEGTGLIFIKRLTQALADQDRIYAVIRSTASNQDGRTPAMAVPGEAAQIALLQDVYEKAGIDPAHVAYMEAHGTGTPVGDPIETSAIGKVLAKGRASQVPCRIGSVKTNIGHLESASGIAGVIKAALVLDRMTIPPNRNFEKPNPNIPFDDLNLRVVTKAEPLLIDGCRAIVGVNSFGFGGTNAHAALEAAPSLAATPRAKALVERPFVLPLSARDDVALRALAQKFRRYLATDHGPLGDICYSAGARREHHPNRLVVSGRDSAELRHKLDAWLTSQSSEPGITVGSAAEQQAERITFVYSGQGGQWWRMGRDLLQREPIFRAAVEEIDAALSKYAKWSLREEFIRDEQDSNIHRTDIAQPAIFALQVGLTRLWKSWGILPQQVIGHSVGEVAAALAAGVLNLEDAVKVIFHRSRLQHQTAGNGGMAAVGLSEEKARAIVANAGATLEVAAVNSPSLVTLAGDAATLDSVLGTLESEGVFVRRLPIDYAFHTYQMDIIQDELLASLADIRPVAGKIPIISTVTGAEIDGSQMGAEYWWSNVRQPVRFAQGIESCVKAGAQAFVEVGPHASMESSIRECVAKSGSTAVIVNSLRRETDESVELLHNLARLHLAGAIINWASVNQSHGQFVRLPSYPWNWKSHWLQSTESKNDLLDPEVTALLGVPVLGAMPTWESEPNPLRIEYLQDHRIWNNVIFPAAAFADIALALVRHLHPDNTHVVEELKIEKALFLSSDGVQLLHTVYNEKESSFAIFSSDDDRIKWDRHASGHITKMPPAEPQAVSIESLQSQLPGWIDHEEIYRNFSEAGFQFGGRFQNIQKLWRGAEQSLAEIVAPDSITASLASSCFHPALLDACFQATTGLLPSGSTGLPSDIFLPASVQRIQMYCPQIPRHFYARAINARWQDDSITADIFVYGIDGEPIAEILGFRAEKFAQRRAAGDIPVSMYQYKWRPGHLWGSRGAGAANLAQPQDIAAAARERVADVSAKYETDRLVHDYLPQSERVVCLYIENAYRKLKWAPSAEFGLDEAVAGLGAVERYRGLIKVQLDAIARYTGAVTALADERWRVNRPWTDEDAGEALDKLRKAFPSSEAESILLAAAGPHFSDILCGIADPLNILFPGGSSELVEPFYSRSAAGRAYNDLIQTAVTAALKAVPERRAVRILEVGGGTGSLTRGILPILPSHKTEYTFTDLSPAFFAAARQHFSKFPFVKYQPFDIERSPKGQDIPAAGYDIIVASDVIHATRSLADTLDNLKECLAPGGILLFLELSRSLALIENTFGLLEGWWKFSDFRKYSPILSPDGWRQVLLKQGFEDVQSFVSITGNESDAVQAVHVARVPETTPAAEQVISSIGGLLGKNKSELNDRVVVFADRNGVGAAVAKELQAQGLQTIVVQSQEAGGADDDRALKIDPVSEQAIGAFFSEHFPAGTSPLAVVDCWSLDNPAPALTDDNAEILVSQVKGVQHLRRLLRVVVQQWPKTLPKLAVVTRGGQCVHEAEGIARIDSAPIVGFLRVARNEFPEASCLHIDLDTVADSHEIGDLIAELTLPDAEGEIALRQGRRYVHRLHEINEDTIVPLLSDARRQDGSLTPYRLELGKPGSLNNVSLNACARRSPASGEMEVEIKAAGINFRDLMKTLGMYPWKPGEVRMIGDDFSGVVTRIGKDVTQFGVGDAVFGSTLAAFSSHAIVRPEMVGRKADFISFAEAAGLPSVFLTAHYALVHLARMQPKERVLIHAGAGGVGQAAIQVAKTLGLEIFATAGTPERRQLLKDMGVDHAMDSRSLRFADDVMAATNGEGVDAVLNSLSGDFIAKNLSVLAPFGRMIEIGKIDIYGDTKIGLSPFRKNISFFALDLDLVINKKPALAIELAREVNERILTGVYKPLPYHSFPVTEASDALRLMAQAKHVGKIVLDFDLASIPIAPAKDDSTFFRPDAFYLVSGGASGVGLELVRWMHQCGARHFALLSRSGPRDERDVQAIEELRVAGAEVLDIRGDVTSQDDVIRAVVEANRPDVPLRGIFHCAMVLNDQFISELDDEQFNRTFHPKMAGAWNLHVASRDLPLDQFVCFSSFSSAVGLPRQANYNAGNSFLGALANYRRAKGLPGLTIEWGAIQGAGTLERESKVGQFLGQLGVQGIALVELFQKLRYALTRDAGVVAFAKMDWTKLASLVPQIRASKTFELVSVARAKRRGGGWVREELANVGSHAEARDILVNYLTARVAEILGTDAGAIEVLKPFSQLGIDSLMAVELVQGVEADLDLTLGMGAILGGSRLTDLADSLARKLRSDLNADEKSENDLSDAEIKEQMVDDCSLADSIHFQRGLGRRSANGRILVTGATGFLGAYVLKELLLRETSEIVCIVRAEAGEAGVGRIIDNLKKYGLLDNETAFRKRVKVALGDLAKPCFGLTQEEFDGLAARVDAVYHLAAQVNHLLDYPSLRDGNVLSAKHVLEFAAAADHKIEVHYASSLAILSSNMANGSAKVTELDPLPDHPDLTSGYVQTKWVSEHLFNAARERGCPVTIYRFGLITGDERAGASNPTDFLWRSVKAMLDMKKAPNSNSLLYLTPADFAARAMVALSLRKDAEQQTYHIVGDISTGLSDVLEIAQKTGLNAVELVPVDEWIAMISNRLHDADVQSIAPYLAAYPEGLQIAVSPIMEIMRFPIVANALTGEKLAEEGIAMSSDTPDLVALYINDLTGIGYFERA